MRFKSAPAGGLQAFAVTGTNTISFAIDASDSAKRNLLGFAVERSVNGGPKTRMPGFKVFKSIIPKPTSKTRVSTWDHPVQSLVWDDFTGQPDTTYTYFFHPLRGTPSALDRTASPVRVTVRTEKLFTKDQHDIFFNRGVASSQAYQRKFGNKPPDKLATKAKQLAALQWLTRDLDEAIVKFIEAARKGDTLLCCFYEFHYMPVVNALRAAIGRKVKVKIIIDAKVNQRRDTKTGKMIKSFPRVENLKAIKTAKIPSSHIIERDANPSNIQHNKFMVLLKGGTPTDVWTGSTNLSLGGFSGQTNVGHWVRHKTVARAFKKYWDVVAKNLGSAKRDGKSLAGKKKNANRKAVEALGKPPGAVHTVPKGVTTIFSPRSGRSVLDLYVELADKSKIASCVTLAFGINELFKSALKDNSHKKNVVFLLLEKEDTPNKRSKKPFVVINARNNVYKAWGSNLRDPVYQWARETNARQLKLNRHVSFIHSKFLLKDPLTSDPIVVTGSANFSVASTNDNDENMMIIRGDRRVADIYFTEFNRLFNHYYYRAVVEKRGTSNAAARANLFLDETGKNWVKKYAPGTLRAKRLAIYKSMQGFE
jgi:phosphatidylserine/phosphatidylglycerophosphate/cardiolipin synthase-like enzyme